MNKKMDRLQEMKKMTLEVHKRIDGDDYFIGYKSQLDKSLSLIKKEHKDIATDDLSTLQKNYDALSKNLKLCVEDLYNYASLIRDLQLKYDDAFEKFFKLNF